MAYANRFAGAVSLNAAIATGAGTAFDCRGCRVFGLQVVLTNAPATAIVKLEGTIDGTNYFAIGTWDVASVASGDIVFAVDKPVAKIRANCTTLTIGGGKAVTATLSAS